MPMDQFVSKKYGFFDNAKEQEYMVASKNIDTYMAKYLNGTIDLNGAPLAMFFGFWEPHLPWTLPIAYKMSSKTTKLDAPFSHVDEQVQNLCPIGRAYIDMRSKDFQNMFDEKESKYNYWNSYVSMYQSMIKYVDAKVGRILDLLEEGPYANNTVIIFTSDHGWAMGNRKWIGKRAPWADIVRTPLIVTMPSSNKGIVLSQNTATIDLYPTILDLLGIKKPNGLVLHGKSFFDTIMDPSTETKRTVISTITYDTFKGSGVFRGKWHLIELSDTNSTQYELYNVHEDPSEIVNMVSQKKAKVEKLKDALHKKQQKYIDKGF